MDLDCDSESMDSHVHMEDIDNIDIKEEPIGVGYEAAHAGLSLIPLVYTTRLDDMAILNSNTSQLRPRKVTAAIVKESKPPLHTFPNDNISRANKKTFNAIKAKLKKIYYLKNTNLETSDVKLEFPDPIFNTDTDFIKCEVPEDTIDTSKSEQCHVEEDFDIKSEVLECKYSELLKLCRPCSVVLPKLHGYEVIRNYSAQRYLTPKPVTSKSNVNKTAENNDAPIDLASSSDEEPLITLNPKLRLKLESNDSELMNRFKTKTGAVKVSKPSHNRILDAKYEETLIASFNNRILTDGLLEVKELYSNECDIYCTNNKGNLLAYYKEKDDMLLKNKQELVKISGHSYFSVKSCCWAQRDRIIQALYPKVLLYSSLRFMRKPHTCPPGACSCCCQEIPGPGTDKADMVVTKSRYSDGPPPFLKDIKIQALEKEIQSTIIQMNKEPRIYPDSILWNLLDNPKTKLPVAKLPTRCPMTLIDKALMYKKPLPKKPINNRRLVSLKLENSQACVIVLRNFAADEREIYELNPDGELKSYLKLTCFHNTDRPDVKKLMQNTKHVNDVCCWFKRENIITELIESKTIHLSTVKFIRTRHTCTGDECSCCCKPAETKDIRLAEITFPKRPFYWSECISRSKAPHKPPKWFKNIMNKPPSSSVTIPASSPHLSAPKLLPKNMPLTTKMYVPVTPAKPIDNQLMESVSYEAATITTPTPDDDCQFVGVRAAPNLGHELKSTQTEQPQNITNVQSEVLSEEVNTLITSILERFKDVRLTINSDGKVAAALNTPVSSLTTVELKVLANILSYAQSQVNSLGLNAGTSLSNIINFKVSDPQSAINLDPAGMYKVLGNNVNVTVRNQTAQVNTATANISHETKTFPDLSSPATKYDMFTKCMAVKNREYTNSFGSLLTTKLNAEPEKSNANSNVPVIQNVFSLKDQGDINTGIDTSSTTVFSRKPANQSQQQQPSASQPDTQKINDNEKKRAPDDAEVTPVTKKIRVLSPSKLHASPVDEFNSNPMVNSVYQPCPTIQDRALEIGGIRSGFPLLSNINNNFRVVSVRPQAPVITKPRIIREHNFKPLTPLPSIVVAPLQVANLNDNVVPMGTPFSVAPVGASTREVEIQEIPIKLEQEDDEEVDCILGV